MLVFTKKALLLILERLDKISENITCAHNYCNMVYTNLH